MRLGFQQNRIRVWTGDGLNDLICDCLDYIARDGSQYRVPIGGTTDGLSVPRIVQNIIPASGNDSWMAGVLHDSAYRGQLLRWNEPHQEWLNAALTREQSDGLMLEALELQGIGWLRRKTIYRALRMFGGKAWNDNRTPAGISRNQLQPVNFDALDAPPVDSSCDGETK